MKKIFFGFLACAALFVGLTSCNNEVDNPSSKDEVKLGPVRIVIGCQSDDTKVYYNDVNDSGKIYLQPYWEVGDKVLVLYGEDVSELEIESIIGDGTEAIVVGESFLNTTVLMVYKKDFDKAAWGAKGGIPVDYSNQKISHEEGKYYIDPVVLAGTVTIDENGYGSGELDYQCGIVKVSAVRGVPAGQKITKISLWGDKITSGIYTYDTSTKELVYTTRMGDKVDGCQELKVEVADGEIGYDDAMRLDKAVFFAVPADANLKQATVTTDGSFYFHNIEPEVDQTTGQVTRLGVGINERDYYNIEEFEEYYFTVKHMSPPSTNGNPEKDAKKIQLAPGNLYAKGIKWNEEDGIATNPSEVKFYFEKNQWDYRYICGATGDNCVIESKAAKTEETTCGSFLWSEYSIENQNFTNAQNAYGQKSIYYGPTPYGPKSTNSEFFTQNANFVVSGQPEDREYKWYTLTGYEWDYLVKQRLLPCETYSSINYTCSYSDIKVNDNLIVKGLIIFHDNYLGPKSNLDYIPDGCAFLPAVSLRTEMTVSAEEFIYDGSYWADQLGDTKLSYLFVFFEQGPNGTNQFGIYDNSDHANGRAIRLARNLPTPENPTGD